MSCISRRYRRYNKTREPQYDAASPEETKDEATPSADANSQPSASSTRTPEADSGSESDFEGGFGRLMNVGGASDANNDSDSDSDDDR